MTLKSQTRFFKGRHIYLDYAASTPAAKEVVEVMKSYFTEHFGNPGSTHYFGQKAQAAIDKAREAITKAIGAKFNEVIFTGSATEANNLALRGAIRAYHRKSIGISANQRPRLIVSAIEHESVLDTARDLEKEGVEVVYLPVDKEGFVDLKKLKESLNGRAILVSIIYASNEIGTIQPITEIAKVISEFKKQKIENRSRDSKFYFPDSAFYPLFHTDAVQAFQFLDCDVHNLGVDLMTLSAQKIYGPKGIGALYFKNLESRSQKVEINDKKIPNSKFYFLNSIITGGGQEYGLRSGTENVPAIVGFSKAVELIQKNKNKEAKRIKGLRDYFWRKLHAARPELELNGPSIFSPLRLPNNLNIYFPGHDSQDLLIKFDLNGLSLSAGSACSARSVKVSRVIEVLGLEKDRAKSSLRVSLGRPTNKKHIDTALKLVINLL